MKTHSRGAALQQFASEGEVAAALVLSYTLDPVHEAKAPPPSVISLQVATNGAGTIVPVRGVAKYNGVAPLPPHNA